MHLLALFLIAAPAASPDFPGRGSAGITLNLPNGSDPTLVGATWFLSNDVAVRGDFGLSFPITPSGAGQNKTFTLSAAVRWYGIKRDHVGVFLQPAFAFGRELSPAVTAEAAEFVRFGGGVGVEYFFTNHFSVGGLLELALKFANLGGPGGTPVYTSLTTDASTISANVYF